MCTGHSKGNVCIIWFSSNLFRVEITCCIGIRLIALAREHKTMCISIRYFIHVCMHEYVHLITVFACMLEIKSNLSTKPDIFLPLSIRLRIYYND